MLSEGDLSSRWDSDDEYEKFIQRMNPPRFVPFSFLIYSLIKFNLFLSSSFSSFVRVVIDNESCANATVVNVSNQNFLFSFVLRQEFSFILKFQGLIWLFVRYVGW